MFGEITKIYWTLFRGLLVLAMAGAISAGGVQNAADAAAKSVRTGLISLKRLNAALGM